MTEILMDTYRITGENAKAAADYINEQESRMISVGAGNPYFSDDYFWNMERFKSVAAEKFGVVCQNIVHHPRRGNVVCCPVEGASQLVERIRRAGVVSRAAVQAGG